jgi:hypothetical protein
MVTVTLYRFFRARRDSVRYGWGVGRYGWGAGRSGWGAGRSGWGAGRYGWGAGRYGWGARRRSRVRPFLFLVQVCGFSAPAASGRAPSGAEARLMQGQAGQPEQQQAGCREGLIGGDAGCADDERDRENDRCGDGEHRGSLCCSRGYLLGVGQATFGFTPT